MGIKSNKLKWMENTSTQLRGRPRSPSEKIHEAFCLYKGGMSQDEASLKTGISRRTLSRYLQAAGEKVRTFSEAARVYPLNEKAFADRTSEEVLYWVGMLLADGNIYHKKGNWVMQLGLKESDGSHLSKLQCFLKTDKPVEKAARKCRRLRINSRQLCEDLMSFGIVPKKSLIARLSGDVEMSRHVFRGLIDGDGTLSWQRKKGKKVAYPRITLVGSHCVTQQFANFVKHLTGHTVRPRPRKKIWQVATAGKFAAQVIHELYDEASVYLDRKMLIAKQMHESPLLLTA